MPHKEIVLEQPCVNVMAEIYRRYLTHQFVDLLPLVEELEQNNVPYTYLIEIKETDRETPPLHRDLIIVGAFCSQTANGNRDPELATSTRKPMLIIYPQFSQQFEIVPTDPQQIETLLTTSRFAGSFDGRQKVFGWMS